MKVIREHGEYVLVMDGVGCSEALVRTKFRRMNELHEENQQLKAKIASLEWDIEMNSKRPSEVWGMGVNTRGIWGGRPIKFFWNEEFREYLNEGEGHGVFGLGLVEKPMCTTFASVDRKEVVAFIKKTKEELSG